MNHYYKERQVIADTKHRYTNEEQRFFFPVNHEAIATPDFCALERPQVELLDNRLVVAEYTTEEGVAREGYQRLGWRQPLPMGSTLRNLVLVNSLRDLSEYKEGTDESEASSETRTVVDIPDGADIIWAASDIIYGMYEGNKGFDAFVQDRYLFTQPVSQSLPRYEGTLANDLSFKPLGFIHPKSGKLTTWNNASGASEQTIDIVVALKEAKNRLELALVSDSIGVSYTLNGVISTSDTTSAYLKWYNENKGVDYMPTKEPRERMYDFPDLSKKQFRRYEKLMELNSNILKRRVKINLA
jgi:hypothetical protein